MDESAASCLNFGERPETPVGVRKFRKSRNAAPGKSVVHWGVAKDVEDLKERLGEQAFGVRSSFSAVTAADSFKLDYEPGSLAEYVQEQKEMVYKTKREEPLGKPFVRGFKFDSLREERLESKMRDDDLIKSLVNPPNQEIEEKDTEEEERVRRLYVKSHHNYKPGEQRTRNYNWKGIDPKTHRFGGVGVSRSDEGASFCLQPDVLDAPKKITSMAVAKRHAMKTDQLGKPRFRGNLESVSVEKLEDYRRRLREKAEPVYTARDCIQGSYSIEEQQPDADLGKATRPGWRNFVEPNTRYGCPTVRTDVKPPMTRSVSDNTNYGDDTSAAQLLYPSRFVAEGVEDADFLDPVDAEDIRSVMARVGHNFSDEDFQRIHAQASKTAGSSRVSIKEFLEVGNELFRARDHNTLPSWWN